MASVFNMPFPPMEGVEGERRERLSMNKLSFCTHHMYTVNRSDCSMYKYCNNSSSLQLFSNAPDQMGSDMMTTYIGYLRVRTQFYI